VDENVLREILQDVKLKVTLSLLSFIFFECAFIESNFGLLHTCFELLISTLMAAKVVKGLVFIVLQLGIVTVMF